MKEGVPYRSNRKVMYLFRKINSRQWPMKAREDIMFDSFYSFGKKIRFVINDC